MKRCGFHAEPVHQQQQRLESCGLLLDRQTRADLQSPSGAV